MTQAADNPTIPRWLRPAWLAVALLPPVIAVGVPAWILWRGGEFVSPDRAAEMARPGSPPALYGLAYSNPTNRYKRLAAYAEKRDVVALGTSRVLQIRSEFFRPGTRFFNAGQAVANLNGYAPMIEEWPSETLPGLIVAGMDQYFYNEEWREEEGEWTGLRKPADSPLVIAEKNWHEVWDDLAEKRIPWGALWADREAAVALHGLSARVHRAGFRNDGSYRYGRQLAVLASDPSAPFDPLEAFDDTLERIAEGARRYEFGREVYPRSVEDTRRFLSAARARGVEVIGFLPPYANAVWERMMGMGERYEYMRRLPEALREVFAEHGFAFFEFQSLAAVGAEDREAIDGFHPGEKAAARLLLAMARDHPRLGEHVDAEAVGAALDASVSPFELFPDPAGD